MTAPETHRILPYGLPGGCYRFSTVNGKSWNAPMSEVGQKQTSDCRLLMSAIHPKADIVRRQLDGPFLGNADMRALSRRHERPVGMPPQDCYVALASRRAEIQLLA